MPSATNAIGVLSSCALGTFYLPLITHGVSPLQLSQLQACDYASSNGVPTCIMSSSAVLQQSLFNLVSNASTDAAGFTLSSIVGASLAQPIQDIVASMQTLSSLASTQANIGQLFSAAL